jgi:hypothetical protein
LWYYSVSPAYADWIRDKPVFRAAVRLLLWPVVTVLHVMRTIDTSYYLAAYVTCFLVVAAAILFVRKIAVLKYSN